MVVCWSREVAQHIRNILYLAVRDAGGGGGAHTRHTQSRVSGGSRFWKRLWLWLRQFGGLELGGWILRHGRWRYPWLLWWWRVAWRWRGKEMWGLVIYGEVC